MVVELGIAFDVLVAAVLFGIFFFHIRTSIDSLDVDKLNRLNEVDKCCGLSGIIDPPIRHFIFCTGRAPTRHQAGSTSGSMLFVCWQRFG